MVRTLLRKTWTYYTLDKNDERKNEGKEEKSDSKKSVLKSRRTIPLAMIRDNLAILLNTTCYRGGL